MSLMHDESVSESPNRGVRVTYSLTGFVVQTRASRFGGLE